MKLSFSPTRCDNILHLAKSGDVLEINGEAFDFSALDEDASLPQAAVHSDWLASDVIRKDGMICMTLILPHGAAAPHSRLFPETVLVEKRRTNRSATCNAGGRRMSNIDFSCLVTASTKASLQAVAHAAAVKAECKRRILAQFSQEAQQNLAQAATLYALKALQETAQGSTSTDAALTDADILQVHAGWRWINTMQAASRTLSQDPKANPLADTVWPAMPENVAQLITRY